MTYRKHDFVHISVYYLYLQQFIKVAQDFILTKEIPFTYSALSTSSHTTSMHIVHIVFN